MMSPRLPRELLSHARRARRLRLPALATVAVTAVLVTAATPAAALAAAGSNGGDDRAASRAWSPFFEVERPVTAVDGRRVIVTFDDPSLGEWVAAGERTMSAKERTAWLRKARTAQQARLDALSMAGVRFTVEHRYLRVLNGVSLLVHGDGSQLLAEMEGVTSVVPVRTVWPAAVNEQGSAGAAAAAGAASGADGADGAVRVAVLDSALDASHSALAGRVGEGFDATAERGERRGSASEAPTAAAAEHGTAVAGSVLRGAGDAASVSLLPITVLAQRPTRDGVERLLGESDDLLAGLEHAVDPDRTPGTSDGAHVAVVASSTPYAGFAGSLEARAVAAASALGTVVVAAAGNDGASGDSVGTVGSVAAARDALAVGAVDLRGKVRVADVRVRGGGIDETIDGAAILNASELRLPSGELAVVTIGGIGDEVVDYLDAELRSRVTGAVALVVAREGVLIANQVRAAADAGAIAVLVAADGASAAAGTIDVPGADIPAVALPRDDAFALYGALQDGTRLSLTMAARTASNEAHGSVAGFSSAGPRLDGIGRPDLLAPGVGMLVPAPGGGWHTVSGTSIAAAWAAGQAAALRAEHPNWSAETLRAALIGSATPLGSNSNRPGVSAQGGGVADTARAGKVAVLAGRAGRLDFGTIAPGTQGRVALELRAVDGTPLAADTKILLDDGGSGAPVPTLAGGELVLDVPADAADGHVGGWLVLGEHGVRVPWTATVRDAAAVTTPMRATISNRVLARRAGPGAYASTLQLAIGGDAGDAGAGALGLGAVQQLEVRLVDSAGKDHGAIGRLEHALPGVYTFGVNGVDAQGAPLKRGAWQLKVRYVPAVDPSGEWRDGPATTVVVRAAKRAK